MAASKGLVLCISCIGPAHATSRTVLGHATKGAYSRRGRSYLENVKFLSF